MLKELTVDLSILFPTLAAVSGCGRDDGPDDCITDEANTAGLNWLADLCSP